MEYKNKSAEITELTDSKILQILLEFNKLKNLYRQGWLKSGIDKNKCESVADHSFSTTITALFLAEHFQLELNLEKTIIMALIHETGEIVIGDITPHDDITAAKKYQMELESVKKIFSGWKYQTKFLNIWKEFEEGKTVEARYVKALDKLDMALQAKIYEMNEKKSMRNFYENLSLNLPEDLAELLKEIKNL